MPVGFVSCIDAAVPELGGSGDASSASAMGVPSPGTKMYCR